MNQLQAVDATVGWANERDIAFLSPEDLPPSMFAKCMKVKGDNTFREEEQAQHLDLCVRDAIEEDMHGPVNGFRHRCDAARHRPRGALRVADV